MQLFVDDKYEFAVTADIETDKLRDIGNTVLEIEGMSECKCDVNLILVNSDEIKTLNKIYRGKDYPTDVLSFPQYENLKDADEVDDEILLGDIVINTDKVISQADEFGHGKMRETVYLFTHSMFHLFGYDHMTKTGKDEMREREEYVLERHGITR